MSTLLNSLLAFTRHGFSNGLHLCMQCAEATLREELSSLSHADDIERLVGRNQE